MKMAAGLGSCRIRVDFSLPFLLAATGCTRFASELDQVEVAQAREDRWSCVAEQAGNPVMPAYGPQLDYPLSARDYLSGQTPANLVARACFRADVGCTQPATEYFSPDENGLVTLPLTEGFNGYIEITSDGMVPTLFLFPAPLTPELVGALSEAPVSLLSFQALQAFGGTANLELNPMAGVVSMNTYDCLGPSAANVRLELNASAIPFIFTDGLPIAFTDTTTDDGSGGFANVLPGLVVVKGFEAGTTELVGLETVLVRSQWVTVGSLMPQFAAF